MSFFLNPYFQVPIGFLLMAISLISLGLPPKKLAGSLISGISEAFDDATEDERENLKGGPFLPPGCWVFLMGLVIFLAGIFRILAVNL